MAQHDKVDKTGVIADNHSMGEVATINTYHADLSHHSPKVVGHDGFHLCHLQEYSTNDETYEAKKQDKSTEECKANEYPPSIGFDGNSLHRYLVKREP